MAMATAMEENGPAGDFPRRGVSLPSCEGASMAALLQDTFLLKCIEDAKQVTLLLTNGVQLRGAVKGFDAFTISLECDGKTYLIYKHAIATISPP